MHYVVSGIGILTPAGQEFGIRILCWNPDATFHGRAKVLEVMIISF
jgi:hypothetical protein